MATNTKTTNSKREENQELKHLGFIKVFAVKTLICISNLYEYAKHNSGPLRSGIPKVESTVSSLLGPIYDKFSGYPYHLLVFLDKKVDEAEDKFDEHASPMVKKVFGQAWSVTQKASQLTLALVSEVRTKGVLTAAKCGVSKSEHYFSEQAVKTWYHMVTEIAAPAAAHWSNKYNQTVSSLAQKGYILFGFLPLLPVDTIVKAFKRGEATKDV